MGNSGLAACPRCGAKPRETTARFCARCGIELPEINRTPLWAAARPASGGPPGGPGSRPPVQHRLPLAPPQIAPSPPQYPLQPQPRPVKPPPAKSHSGCGCLLLILVVLAIFVAVGRYSACKYRKSSPADVATPTFEPEAAADLPSRPMGIFRPPASSLGGQPLLQNCTVDRVVLDGAPHYQIRAWVRPGPQGRVLLAAYFVDGFGHSVREMGYGTSNRESTLCAGAWVSGGGDRAYSPEASLVELNMPVRAGRTLPASVQFSLFDEQNVELARWNLGIQPGLSSPYYIPR